MNISFIILTWNSIKEIKKCLDSINVSLQDGRYKYEIFIVDNGSVDGTRFFLETYKELFPDTVRHFFLEKNMGTTYSRNLAIKKAKGDIIIIMDSDVVIFDSTLDKLVNVLRDDSKVGLAAPKLIYKNGMLQKSTDNFPTFWNKILRYFFLKSIEKNENKACSNGAIKCVDYAISALWAIKRDVVTEVGLLDEKIFYAPEDVDYCLRIWKAGYKVIYVPCVTAIHNAQEISRGFKINKAMVNHILGLIYYFRKHKYLFKRPTFV